MELSAIIVTWTSALSIRDCLDSLIRELSEIDSEVTVVDNHSSDDTVQIIEKDYPHITLIKNEQNAGFGAAKNEGIGLSSGKSILLLNPDKICHSGALQEMFQFIQNNPQAGMV